MKTYVIPRNDGGVSILTADPKNILGVLEAWTAIQIEADNSAVANGGAPKNLRASGPVIEIDPAVIPTTRDFREAWMTQAGKIEHDMAKCKAIAHVKLKAKMAKELAPLVIEATTTAEAARQVIRDKYAVLKVQVESATDLKTLRTVMRA